jgi:hypothetical protein
MLGLSLHPVCKPPRTAGKLQSKNKSKIIGCRAGKSPPWQRKSPELKKAAETALIDSELPNPSGAKNHTPNGSDFLVGTRNNGGRRKSTFQPLSGTKVT